MKKTTSTLLATVLLLGAAVTSAHAQSTGPAIKTFGTGELPEFLKAYDLNNDGVLSVEERQAYEKATRVAKPGRPGAKNPFDTDGDGKLSDEEKEAARDAIGQKIQDQRAKRFNELDVNADGFLTAIELAAIPRITPEQIIAMIAHLSKDADGKISRAEFLAAMQPVERPFPPLPMAPPYIGRFSPVLNAFDADRNGQISPTEFAAFKTAVDADANGTISPAEWRAYLLAHPELLPPPRDGPPAAP